MMQGMTKGFHIMPFSEIHKCQKMLVAFSFNHTNTTNSTFSSRVWSGEGIFLSVERTLAFFTKTFNRKTVMSKLGILRTDIKRWMGIVRRIYINCTSCVNLALSLSRPEQEPTGINYLSFSSKKVVRYDVPSR